MGWLMKPAASILVFLCCLLPPLAIAAEEIPKQISGLVTTPNSRDLELRMLLRDLGVRMHKHFLLDPREITYPQLLAVLEVIGFVAVADEGIVRVVPNTDVRQMALPIVSPESIKTLD